MQTETLKTKLQENQITLGDDQIEQTIELMNEIVETNKKINLTRITDENDFIDKHIIDALPCPLNQTDQKIIDVGTGGGFPGLPLAIAYPQRQWTLMDATEKKIRAIERIAKNIGVHNVTFITGRAEELAHQKTYRENFDAVVSRAVANLPVLTELCAAFIVPDGHFYAWKGEKSDQEIREAQNAFETLGLEVESINHNLLLKNTVFHVIIQCRKTGITPKEYPRNFGQIKKKPL